MIKDKKLVSLFVDEVSTHINLARGFLVASLEKSEPIDEIQKILKILHTVKGSSGILGLEDLSDLVHKLETFFQKIRENGYDDISRLKAIRSIEQLDKFIKEFPDNYDKNVTILKNIIDNKSAETVFEDKTKQNEEDVNPPKLNKNSLDVLKRLIEEVRQIVEFNFRGKAAKDTKKFREKIADIIFNIENITLVDLSEIADKIKNISYFTASKCKKDVEVVMNLGDVALDKSILFTVEEALIHLVRNAVYHGIENREIRAKNSKPIKGKIAVNTVSYGGRVKISVLDDGGGINFDKIKQKALKMGIASKERISSISDSEVLGFMFIPGFSTQDKADDIGGRGVGLDIVKESIEKIGGFLTIETSSMGTEFSFEIPISLNVMHCVEISDGGNFVAVPMNIIDKFVMVRPEYIVEEGGVLRIIYDGISYDYIRFKNMFKSVSDARDKLVMLTRGGRVALGFNEFIGDRIFSIKQLKGIVGKIPGIVGLSVTDSFYPIAVINPLNFGNDKNTISEAEIKIDKKLSGKVLVVEDNNLIREMITDYLEVDGYEVVSANDGIKALGIIKSHKPNLIITDIEMPNMDGITLLKAIREKDKIVPVLILSSKGEDKDIKDGIENGANGYFVKRYFSRESLLKKIRELI